MPIDWYKEEVRHASFVVDYCCSDQGRKWVQGDGICQLDVGDFGLIDFFSSSVNCRNTNVLDRTHGPHVSSHQESGIRKPSKQEAKARMKENEEVKNDLL